MAEGLEPGSMKERRLWNTGTGAESLLHRMPCAPALNSACPSATGGCRRSLPCPLNVRAAPVWLGGAL